MIKCADYPYTYNKYLLHRYGVPILGSADRIHNISVHKLESGAEVVYIYGDIQEIAHFVLYPDGSHLIRGTLVRDYLGNTDE